MLLILLTWFATLAIASTVSVNLPLEDQLPPTARINKAYSWTFNQNSFVSDTNASLVYSASSLPKWLSFDPDTRTFHGTPSDGDEGHPEVTVSVQDSVSSSSYSTFSFCVSEYPPPTLNIPLEKQFDPSSQSLSSVFALASDSALLTSNPALRIPPAWSFSIGIESDTFSGNHSAHYAALQVDGSPLPSWIKFNTRTLTFNGFTPSINGSLTIPLALHSTDKDGYSSTTLPFDLIVAGHELRSTHSLPTINITSSTPFNMTINSAFDFSGVLVDEKPIQPVNISTLMIDVSQYSGWLRYDGTSRQLSGTPPANLGRGVVISSLPVTIATDFDQTIHTNVSIAVVPSYFITEIFSSLNVKPDDDVKFNLSDYLSPRADLGAGLDVDLSADFSLTTVDQFLKFDNITHLLTGTIPSSIDYDSIKVTFTAFSRITHSTSHASLDIGIVSRNNKTLDPTGLPPNVRSKLILGVGIAFAVIGGLFVLIVSLAICRRCTRVNDTALEGEEGRRGWTKEEKKWYGLDEERESGDETVEEKMVVNFKHITDGACKYGSLGLGVRDGISTRSPINFDAEGVRSPGSAVMKKAEFFDRLRSTVRAVSDKYRTVSEHIRPIRPRLVIGRPALVTSTNGRGGSEHRSSRTENSVLGGTPVSFSHGGSPSSSTYPSIPTRRADFGPASHSPPPNKRTGRTHGTKRSVDSVASNSHSLSSRSSLEVHADEAVVHTARALSVRSGKSVSFPYPLQTNDVEGVGKPRLVPFTKSSHVPVPRLPSTDHTRLHPVSNDTSKRITSHSVQVEGEKVQRDDDLSVAMSYVRAFGSDPIEKEPRSFYSLESSHGSTATQNGMHTPRFLARVGERFVFTICATKVDRPEVKLISGELLPAFLRVTVSDGDRKGMIQLWGTPQITDVGEMDIGVYDHEDGRCIGRAIGEVVART